MPIKYDKLIALMRDRGITSYTLKRDNIIGQATYKKIMEGGDIDTRTIAKLCKLLECQPGDILEYVPEELPSRAAEAPPAPEVAEIVHEVAEEIPTSPKAPTTSEDISVLDLSVRTFNIVCRAGVHTVAELEAWVHSDQCCLDPNRSPGYKEILEALKTYKENTRK